MAAHWPRETALRLVCSAGALERPALPHWLHELAWLLKCSAGALPVQLLRGTALLRRCSAGALVTAPVQLLRPGPSA